MPYDCIWVHGLSLNSNHFISFSFFFYSDAHHIHIIPPHLWLCLLSADAFATATVVHILRVFVSLMQLLVSVTHLFEPKVYVT